VPAIRWDPFSNKHFLILEEQSYRYLAAISNLAGSDVEAHNGDHQTAVRKVRNWLISSLPEAKNVSAGTVLGEYEDFQEWYYKRQLDRGFTELDIQDYSTSELLDGMIEWMSSDKPRG